MLATPLLLGTFLYDTPKERVKVKVSEKTQSLWWVGTCTCIIYKINVNYNDIIFAFQCFVINLLLHCLFSRDHLLSPAVLSSLLNPLYEKNNGVLLISTHPCSIVRKPHLLYLLSSHTHLILYYFVNNAPPSILS